MKSTVENIGTLGRKLNVSVPAEIVASAFESAFRGAQKNAALKGFRPGKAPLQTIKQVYGDRIKQDVAQDLIQKHYYKAVQEHKLEPISYPEFEFDVVTEGKEFSFTANFEVRPEVTLKKYEGLEVQKEKIELGDDKVQAVITNILSSRAETVPVLENRPAGNNDIAIIDFKGTIDGKPLEGGTGTDHSLEIGSKQFIEGFEEGVIGMNVGQTKTLTLKFPDPYHSAELAGKAVVFEVTLKELKKKSLPEFTDEFVSQLMNAPNDGTHTVAKMKATILEDMTKSETKRIDGDFKNRMLKALVTANPTEVPAALVKDQKQALIDDMKKRMLDQGLSENDFQAYESKWDSDFDATAKEMIQSGFLIDAIAKKHDLNWTEEDLNTKYEEYAKQTGLEVSKIADFYSRPDQQNRVTYMITEEKVLAYLASKAKVSEVDKSKLK